jgi:Reverse transcriptase (RNA-dependent DNA polymerase)
MKEVYVEQPEGFKIKDKENWVYRHYKALYDLKQTSRAWYNKIDSCFQTLGFTRSKNELKLYMKHNLGLLVVCLYVDDMIYFGIDQGMVETFKEQMMRMFKMTYLGTMHYFLGLEIEQETCHMFISQRKYAKDLVEKFGMKGCNLVQTLSNVNEKLIAEDGTEHVDATRFRSLVGGLMYLTHTYVLTSRIQLG